MLRSPAFRHGLIPRPPNLRIPINFRASVVSRALRSVALSTGYVMGTARDHRRCAEEGVAMAQRAGDDDGKVVWLPLALSWVRLSEHVARSSSWLQRDVEEVRAVASADAD